MREVERIASVSFTQSKKINFTTKFCSLAFRRRSYGSPEMNDYDCDDEKNFVCEYQHKDTFGVQTVKTPKEELLRFMTPLATYGKQIIKCKSNF